MKKILIIFCGIVCVLAIGIYGYFRIDKTVKSAVETSLNSEVIRLYNENVVIHISSTDLVHKNSELFNITYDSSVLDYVNIFNYRDDYTKYIKTTLREDGFEKLIKEFAATSDSYFFVSSITPDMKLIQTAVEKNILTNKLRQDLELSAELTISDYYEFEEPNNQDVEKEYMDICALQDWKLEYDKELAFTWNDIKSYVSYNDKLVIDDMVYDKLITKVCRQYDTLGETRSLKTPIGEAWVNGGTYGWKVDEEKERAFIIDSITRREQVKARTPEFEQKAYSKEYGDKDLGDKYVVIDISEQHAWVLNKGKVVKESDCVTGTKGKHDTPLGVYAIMEIMPNGKVLRGSDYTTPVNKWIRLTNSGIGLHDASWRSSFGGAIYKSNGSHGCINLPYDFASYLCKNLKRGMPVVIIA